MTGRNLPKDQEEALKRIRQLASQEQRKTPGKSTLWWQIVETCNYVLYQCTYSPVSSRVCEVGTSCCNTHHNIRPEDLIPNPAYWPEDLDPHIDPKEMNHETKKVRGLLCQRCNYLAGVIERTDSRLIDEARKYLRDHL